jgi:regulatory protein
MPRAHAPAARDPAAALQRARELAYRHLARRDRTVVEIERHLDARGLRPPEIREVLAELEEQGYLDDAGFAHRFAEDRRRLDGWGSQRIEQRLRALGIAREHVDAALRALESAASEVEAAAELLRRRYGAAPLEDPRALERALGVLVRKGFDLELAHDAVRAHARGDA